MNIREAWTLPFGLLFVVMPFFAAHSSETDAPVTFKYAPAEWQTAICLPDDPCKSLVDHDGRLLYHYNKPGGAFDTKVSVVAEGQAMPAGQRLLSPRIPIVITMRATESLSITEEAFAVSGEMVGGDLSRSDVILISATNRGHETKCLRPAFHVTSTRALKATNSGIVINGHEMVLSTHPVEEIAVEEKRRSVGRMLLAPLEVDAGKTARFALVCRVGEAPDAAPVAIEKVLSQRRRAERWWAACPLPFGGISIPDPNIQALIDSSIRNIWQAREIKNDLPAFQVGPSCYRGLWIIDGAFLLETATMIGAADEARAGLRYMLDKQQPSGAFQLLTPTFYKENGIVLWACVRHARLTQDKEWLRAVWPQLEKTVGFIKTLRERSRENPEWLCHGLVPPGESDGGLWHNEKGEYTNVYWSLIGLKAAVQGARWLEKKEQAQTWQQEYDDFYATFRTLAERDMREDAEGNRYLPTVMGATANISPQRAQWAFCHSVYPGQLYERDDPLVSGNLAMLAATEVEGMVCGTGWDPEGLWNHFASFYGHAWLWQGNAGKACDALYALANHASPLLAWREEQAPRGKPWRKVGDMPHAWAGAEFIRMATHLLAFDRGNELHLLEGMPETWAQPGMVTSLKNIATPFGALTFELAISPEGKEATLQLELTNVSCAKAILHLNRWTGVDRGSGIALAPGCVHYIRIPIVKRM